MASTGNRGRLSERLKKIVFRRRVRNTEEIEDSNKMYINFTKVMAAIPGFIYSNIRDESKTMVHDDKLANNNEENIANLEKTVNSTKYNNTKFTPKKTNNTIDIKNNIFKANVKRENTNISKTNDSNNKLFRNDIKEINKIDIPLIRYNQRKLNRFNSILKKENIGNNKGIQKDNINIGNNKNIQKDNSKDFLNGSIVSEKKGVENEYTINRKKADQLEKKILNIIQKNLLKTANELEILQSELYILSEINGDSKTVEECNQELAKVRQILEQIEDLKKKYDFLSDNYDFEYLLELDDNTLIDKIIELRDTFGNNQLKALSYDYKLLDAYKFLYLRIDSLQDKVVEYEKKKEEEVDDLKARDIDFEELKNNVYNIERVNQDYEFFVKKQNEVLKEISENVSKIDSHEEVSYKMNGFNKLLFNSFKYFGLLMLSPLKGLIPAIATETLITANTVKNLRDSLSLEEERKMVYEAIDYSSNIRASINNLNDTYSLVDNTLDDIVHLKMEYNDKFKEYQNDFSEYRDVMDKLNYIESKLLDNKIKIEIMKKNALLQEKANVKKLELVSKLNNNSNSNSD